MDRVAVFVDAGYVFAQGAALLAGRKLTRSETILDHEGVRRALTEFAQRITGRPLLRIYWYDGTSDGPTPQHLTLAHLDDVKVRLGFVNRAGEQKGVDSLIVTDMIALARGRAMSDAVLLSGDEDLRVGVQQAQEHGVRVHLIGIKPGRGSQSLFLLQEADTTHEWSEAEVAAFLTCRPKTDAAAVSPATPTVVPTGSVAAGPEPLERLAREVAGGIERTELAAIVEAFDVTRQVPMAIDRRLLGGGRAAVGRDLNSAEKKQVRAAFLLVCRARLAEAT